MKSTNLPLIGEVVERDSEGGIPPPKINLGNAGAIRRELARVYRDMRSGDVTTQDGTRLAYVLNILGQAYERDVLEQRVEQLETLSDEHKKPKN